jgi:hypothetical protein
MSTKKYLQFSHDEGAPWFDEGPIPRDIIGVNTVNAVGIDMSPVDQYRQGVEITLMKHFNVGIGKISAGEPGHFLKQNSFGGGKRMIVNLIPVPPPEPEPPFDPNSLTPMIWLRPPLSGSVYPFIADYGDQFNSSAVDLVLGRNVNLANTPSSVVDAPGTGLFARRSLVFDSASSQRVDYGLNQTQFADVAWWQGVWSYSIWFKTSSATTQGLFSKGSAASDGWGLNLNVNGSLTFHMSNGFVCNKVTTTQIGLNDGNWHHFVMTKSSNHHSSAWTCYIDGMLASYVIDADNIVSAGTLNNNFVYLGLAFLYGSAVPNYFNGRIHEFAIYGTKLLTQEQVTWLYNNGSPRDLMNHAAITSLSTWTRLGSSGYSGGCHDMLAADIVADGPGLGAFPQRAIRFEGGTEYVYDVSNVDTSRYNFERTDKFSLTCWLKLTASGYIWTTQHPGTAARAGYSIYANLATGKLRFIFCNDIGAAQKYISVDSAASSISDGNWNHVVMTYDGSSSAVGTKFYINGTLISPNTIIKDTLTASSKVGSAYYRMGGDTVGGDTITAQISEFILFDYELTPSQVARLAVIREWDF